MTKISVSQLNIYPLKSASPIGLTKSKIIRRGLQFDRHWALFDENKKVVTGRTDPRLLGISTRRERDHLLLSTDRMNDLEVPFINENISKVPLKVFSTPGNGVHVSDAVDTWFSEYLEQPCQLYNMNEFCDREVLRENGGKEGDSVSFADESPILLTNEASLFELNQRIGHGSVRMQQFRPNIVLTGATSFQEDEWKRLKIGECEFEINQPCIRCVFTTIDPDTQLKSKNQEPLSTLATFRKQVGGGVSFGVHLIPRKLGEIHVGDQLTILE